jgi:hypothetical protein
MGSSREQPMTENKPPAPEPNLHPIAKEASHLYAEGGGKFTKEALVKLEATLTDLAEKPELGEALTALTQVAQYLDLERKDKKSATALLQIAMSFTQALENLNNRLEAAKADAERRRQKARSKFTGGS